MYFPRSFYLSSCVSWLSKRRWKKNTVFSLESGVPFAHEFKLGTETRWNINLEMLAKILWTKHRWLEKYFTIQESVLRTYA